MASATASATTESDPLWLLPAPSSQRKTETNKKARTSYVSYSQLFCVQNLRQLSFHWDKSCPLLWHQNMNH